MTNEQTAILLTQYRDRLQREVDTLEGVLIEADMEQYKERRHVAERTAECMFGACTNEDHYAMVPTGAVICVDDLRTLVAELDEHIAMLRPQPVA